MQSPLIGLIRSGTLPPSWVSCVCIFHSRSRSFFCCCVKGAALGLRQELTEGSGISKCSNAVDRSYIYEGLAPYNGEECSMSIENQGRNCFLKEKQWSIVSRFKIQISGRFKKILKKQWSTLTFHTSIFKFCILILRHGKLKIGRHHTIFNF